MTTPDREVKSRKVRPLSSGSFYILTALIFLLPVFFMPYLPITFGFAKSGLVFLASIISFIVLAIGYLKKGRFELPSSKILLAGLALVVVYLVSGLLSSSIIPSLFGYGFELETFFAIASLFLLLLSVSLTFRTKDQIFYPFLLFFVSFAIVVTYQFIKIFADPSFLSGGVLVGKSANLIGKWSDLGVFAGLSLVLTLVALEFLELKKLYKILLYVFGALSLFFVALVNFISVWILVGVFALFLFVYALSLGKVDEETGDRKFSSSSLLVIVVALIFVIGGSSLNAFFSNQFNIQTLDARPSWQGTIDVAKASLSDNPIFGSGPNSFTSEWLLHRPDGVNNTIFWDTDFNFGIGFIPTTAVTVGVVGLLIWLLFIGLIIYEGSRVVLSRFNDPVWGFFSLASFTASLYLWILFIFYTPNIVILSLAFIFVGLLIASARSAGSIPTMSIDFESNPRLSFLSVFGLIALAVVSLVGGYVEAENIASHAYFQSGLKKINSGGQIAAAENDFIQAVNLSGKDIYYRAISEANILKLNNLLNQEAVSEDVARSEFQALLGNAIDSAKLAIEYNPTNYQNWLALGRVYEAVSPLKIEGSYSEAKRVYEEALNRNPKNPAIYLILARLEATNENTDKAKEYISKALELKNNYTEAIFLLSQIEVSEGKLDEAIQSVESAALIAPNDPTVFFQLGILRYNNDDFNGAVSALERAVILNPIYSNAKYFLGLSYAELDRINEAIAQFEDIAKLNPDNQEVRFILENLKAGRDPFSNADSSIDTTPEDREELPIEE